jgi:hypothetical protein
VGVLLFINARADVYLCGKNLDTRISLKKHKKGRAYKAAGQLFLPNCNDEAEDIKRMVEQHKCR